mmetsp:Transcript_11730/g.19120  ORF Transcript_11730/g.19120 Transcript_11730/m.19120 type:complete len:92 (+) Transcript_11730:76-351(+)
MFSFFQFGQPVLSGTSTNVTAHDQEKEIDQAIFSTQAAIVNAPLIPALTGNGLLGVGERKEVTHVNKGVLKNKRFSLHTACNKANCAYCSS